MQALNFITDYRVALSAGATLKPVRENMRGIVECECYGPKVALQSSMVGQKSYMEIFSAHEGPIGT